MKKIISLFLSVTILSLILSDSISVVHASTQQSNIIINNAEHKTDNFEYSETTVTEERNVTDTQVYYDASGQTEVADDSEGGISLFAANGPGIYTVSASSSLVVRTGPGSSYSDSGYRLNNGSVAYVYEVSGSWGKIYINGGAYWISLAYAVWTAPLRPHGYNIYTSSTTAYIGDKVTLSYSEIYGITCSATVYVLRNGSVYSVTDIGEMKIFEIYFSEPGTYDIYLQLSNESGTCSGAVGNGSVTIVVSERMMNVTYNYSYNGGTSATKTSASVSYEASADLSVSATKSGWTFVGWNTDPDATAALSSYKVKSDVILYAIFKKNLTAKFYYGSNSLQTTKTVTIYNRATSGNVTTPSLTSYSGWSVEGWRDDTTAAEKEYSNSTSVAISADTIFYGIYSRTLKLSYNANGGSAAPSAQTVTQYYNAYGNKQSKTFTLASAITKSGYTFSGWAKGSTSGTVYGAGSSISITDNTTMYATWTKASVLYSVTYNYSANGGKTASKTADTVAENTNADLSVSATKDGWEFVGWNTSSTATTALSSYKVTGNVTLYAIFKKTLTAKFYSGANNLQTTKTVTIYNNSTGGNITTPSVSSYSGWSADGWRSDTSALSKSYSSSSSVTISSDVNFYGVYSRTLKLSYNANGGSSTPSAQSDTQYYNAYGNKQSKTFTLASAITRSGYTFSGWAKGSTSGTTYSAGNSISITDNTTMYATWTKNTASYTVTYNYSYNGGTSATKQSAVVEQNQYADLSVSATKSGWEFVGWNTSSTATTALSSYKVTGNVTLYAIFRKTLTASFYSRNNALQTTKSVTIYNKETSGAITTPALSSYSGWSAEGWRADTQAEGKEYGTSVSLLILSDISFYGIYSRTLTLSYNANGGNSTPSSQSEKQYYNSYGNKQSLTFTLASAITKSGYTFDKWAKGSTSGTTYSAGSSISITDSTTMYATWKSGGNYCGDNLTWSIDDEGSLFISGSGDMWDYSSSSNAPWYDDVELINDVVIGYGVTSIGAHAFVDCVGLTCVSITEDVTRIGESAFADCENLIIIVIPESVTEIGKYAFDGCENIYYVYYGGSASKWGYVSVGVGNQCLLNANFIYGNKHIISYDANGGEGAPSEQVKEEGTTINLSSTKPTRFPYTFMGWGTSATTSTVSYLPGDWYSDDNHLSLYAVWEGATTLSTSLPAMADVNIAIGKTYRYFKFTPSVSGTYIFESTLSGGDTYGYLYNSSGTELQKNDDGGTGSNFKITYDLKAGTTYYFAARFYYSSDTGTIPVKLSREGFDYTVTYNYLYNGGDSATRTAESFDGEAYADLTVSATKSGWEFVGWNTNPDATTALSSYKVTSDVTLYAIFRKTLTAKFYSGNNSLQTTKSVTIYNRATSGNVTTPGLSSYSGWTAVGWRDDLTADTKEYGNSVSVEIVADTTFYGVYSRTLKLSYNANGGDSTPSTQSATQYYNSYGKKQSKTFTLASAITKSGYTFDKWSKGSTNGTTYSAGSSISITDNTTMYATWKSGGNTCGNNLTWSLDGDGVLTISGSGEMWNYSSNEQSMNAPWYDEVELISEIVIEDGVTSIGTHAFTDCIGLTNVIIPEGVTYIGESAFADCYGIESVIIPDSVTFVGDYAFNECFNIRVVYYTGDNYQWQNVSIGEDNEYLTSNVRFAVMASGINELQSSHPYTNGSDTTWIYVYPSETDNIRITFSDDTYVEDKWDYMYIYDAQDNEIGNYSGYALQNATVEIPGRMVKIRLVSDSSVNKYGFRVVAVEADVPVSYNNLTQTVTITSDVSYSKAKVSLAGYSNGKLISLSSQTKNIQYGSTTVAFDDFNSTGVDTIKVFVWKDMSSIKPLFDKCVVKLK